MNLRGKYAEAKVFTEEVEETAKSQIINLLNQPFSHESHVRIMPDCHAGAGCVIGYTARLTDKVVPNLIGVDIGCGVAAWKLGSGPQLGASFETVDSVIRERVPYGRKVRRFPVAHNVLEKIFSTLREDMLFETFLKEVQRVCNDLNLDQARVWASIGSLGGGNHFIEIDKSREDEFWLVIHSGSRHFGLSVARHHQVIAKRHPGMSSGLEFLSGHERDAYFRDMRVAQVFAKLSRRVMAYEILKHAYGKEFFPPVESVHNYIDFKDRIIRKGAISAHAGEQVVIPFNMADGIAYGTGRGSADWNYSAPHGAGRTMSRRQAKASISVEEFRRRMTKAKVWSSCVGKDTLDEAPQAYKDTAMILDKIAQTVEIRDHLRPVYNFKAAE